MEKQSQEHLAASGGKARAEFPSRKGLLLGAQLVALHGLQQEEILAARHWGYEDWDKHSGYASVTAAINDVRFGKHHYTDDTRILDLMAHTSQTLRVSYEEWEQALMVHRKTPTGEKQ